MFALRAARLFDGVGPSLVDRPTVLVDNGKIVSITSDLPDVSDPPNVEVVDLGDVTLLPGLIDAHLHLAFNASREPVKHLSEVDDDQLLAEMRVAAQTALAAGITTVRDLGDRNYLAVALREERSGPHILAAGPPITMYRGHCWFLGGEADGVDGVRAAVRAHADRGVDVIKVMATGGELTPGTTSLQASYGLAEMRAIAHESHRLGLPCTAHAHSATGIVNAAEAGFDMIEHCSFLTPDGAHIDQRALDAILHARTAVSLTLGYTPAHVTTQRMRPLVPQLIAAFTALREAGVPIVCSSDAGIFPTKPHDVLPYSAAAMQEMTGASTLEALCSVTSTPADACGLGSHRGRLAPGYDADLLAVHGNPLLDLTALTAPAAVYLSGRRVR